jgi:predicted nucleic acid-binding protein
MFFYLDTSALLKRYVQEVGSAWLAMFYDPSANNTLATALITKVEAVAGLSAKFRQGGLPLADYQQAEQDLLHDFVYLYSTIDIDEPLVDLAADLAKRYRLRGYDAVQLAAAVSFQTMLAPTQLSALTLLSADAQLLQAAQQEGLHVDNPNLHP